MLDTDSETKEIQQKQAVNDERWFRFSLDYDVLTPKKGNELHARGAKMYKESQTRRIEMLRRID